MKFREVEKNNPNTKAGLVAGGLVAGAATWVGLAHYASKIYTDYVFDVQIPRDDAVIYQIFELVNGLINLLLSDGTFTDDNKAAESISLFDFSGAKRGLTKGFWRSSPENTDDREILRDEVDLVPTLRAYIREYGGTVRAAAEALDVSITRADVRPLFGNTLTVIVDLRNTAKEIYKGSTLFTFIAESSEEEKFSKVVARGQDVHVQRSFISRALNWIGIQI